MTGITAVTKNGPRVSLPAAPAPPAPLNAFGFHLTGVGLIDRTGVKCLIVFNWGGE